MQESAGMTKLTCSACAQIAGAMFARELTALEQRLGIMRPNRY